jgi:dihydroxy-acid dehydratase
VACPGAGACGGQYTANTMATVLEFIGLSPFGSSSVPATDPRKDKVSFECGKLIMDILRRGTRPSDVLTLKAFENAIASVAATGGSTNAVLHLLAMAREAGIPLSIDDFDRISSRTPLLADLKPGGKYVAVDVDKAAIVPLIAKFC